MKHLGLKNLWLAKAPTSVIQRPISKTVKRARIDAFKMSVTKCGVRMRIYSDTMCSLFSQISQRQMTRQFEALS